VVIADDGLQHLALRRDVEIALIDERMLAMAGCSRRGLCASRRAALIRSTRSCCMARRTHRLACALLQHAYGSRIMRTALATARRALRLTTRAAPTNHANFDHGGRRYRRPQRFFDMLSAAGLRIEPLPLPDHFDYRDNPLLAGTRISC